MSTARDLLEEVRRRGVRLEADGTSLRVDAPAEMATGKTRELLVNNKPQLLKLLHWERRKLEEADRQGLVIKWSRERGWISLHDPTTGEWHQVRASECLPSIVEAANARSRRERGEKAKAPRKGG